MAKGIQEKIIEKIAMNFVNEVSRRVTKAAIDKGEKAIKKHSDAKKAGRRDTASIDDENDIE